MANEENLREYLCRLVDTLRVRVDMLLLLDWEEKILPDTDIGALTESIRRAIDTVTETTNKITNGTIEGKEQQTEDETKAKAGELGGNKGEEGIH